MKDLLEELEKRTIFKDITSKEKFLQIPKGAGVYIGFDPTSNSLQLGNYVQIAILKLFQKYGFKVYAVIGGATGAIGDPSGKESERTLLDKNVLLENKEKVKKQLEFFGLKVIDNLNFYKDMNVLHFLTNVGKLININYMISKDIVKNRLEKGISFTEFSYQLIQGWDFYNLYKEFNVSIQIGGSDQWGNIVTGVEIIRKKIGEENQAVGITTHLLTSVSGAKFGKSEDNALFLDREITKPFEIYQYFVNCSDKDVEKFLLWLTDYSLSQIKEIVEKHSLEPWKRLGQKKLAYKIVSDIHLEKEAKNCERISNLLFIQKNLTIEEEDLNNLKNIVPTFKSKSRDIFTILLETKICVSKREIKEFIVKKAIKINNIYLANESANLNDFLLGENYNILIKKGSKKFFLVELI